MATEEASKTKFDIIVSDMCIPMNIHLFKIYLKTDPEMKRNRLELEGKGACQVRVHSEDTER